MLEPEGARLPGGHRTRCSASATSAGSTQTVPFSASCARAGLAPGPRGSPAGSGGASVQRATRTTKPGSPEYIAGQLLKAAIDEKSRVNPREGSQCSPQTGRGAAAEATRPMPQEPARAMRSMPQKAERAMCPAPPSPEARHTSHRNIPAARSRPIPQASARARGTLLRRRPGLLRLRIHLFAPTLFHRPPELFPNLTQPGGAGERGAVAAEHVRDLSTRRASYAELEAELASARILLSKACAQDEAPPGGHSGPPAGGRQWLAWPGEWGAHRLLADQVDAPPSPCRAHAGPTGRAWSPAPGF